MWVAGHQSLFLRNKRYKGIELDKTQLLEWRKVLSSYHCEKLNLS